MAFIEIPEDNKLEHMQIRAESIDVLGYPRRSSEGAFFTFSMMVNGAKIEPRFTSEEECLAFHNKVKATLGI